MKSNQTVQIRLNRNKLDQTGTWIQIRSNVNKLDQTETGSILSEFTLNNSCYHCAICCPLRAVARSENPGGGL